jgi:DNA-dependent RNA polymerase auxiliary subunit epsilon
MKEKLEIIIKKHDKEYHCYIKGYSELSADGNTRASALGNLLLSNQDKFNIEKITTIDESKAEPAKKKGGFKLPNTGLKSSLPGRW